jgi:chemotaxis protein MotB
VRAPVTGLPGSSTELRRLRPAAPVSPRLATPTPDFADPPPPHGGEDEIWMVSYMDIMTLLLTFFVMLFVYTRVVTPDAAAATRMHAGPPPARSTTATASEPREAAGEAVAAVERLGWLIEPLTPVVATRFDDADVTIPTATVTVVVDAEADAVPSAAPERLANAVEEQPTPAPAEDPEHIPAPTGGAPAVEAVEAGVPTRDTDLAEAAIAADPPAPARAPATEKTAGPEQTLLAAIRASELGPRVEVSVRKDAVNLEISDEILFDRGSAALTASGEKLLAALAKPLAQQAVRVSVEGHTDDSPIRTPRFASNWELSAARATNVTRSLIANAVDPARIRAVGYADTRPRTENASEQGRARNRRVALVLHVPSGDESAW